MDTASAFDCEPRSFKLAFQEGSPVNIAEINEEILDSVSKYGAKAVVAYTKRGRAVTFAELARVGITGDMPREGETVKVLTFDFKEEKLFVLDRQAAIPLARLRLTVAYRALEEAPAPEEKPLDPEDEDYVSAVFVNPKRG